MYNSSNYSIRYIKDLCKDSYLCDEIRHSKKFKLTNKCWSERGGHFNNANKIGRMTKIFKSSKDPSNINCNINYYFSCGEGRSVQQLKEVADEFRKYTLKNSDVYISEQNAWDYLIVRVFYETQLGVDREFDTIKELGKKLPEGMQIQNEAFGISSTELDYRYAVDGICVNLGIPLFGIQIKSKWYKDAKGKIKDINKEKNEEFEDKYQIPVFYVYFNDGVLDWSAIKEFFSKIKGYSFE